MHCCQREGIQHVGYVNESSVILVPTSPELSSPFGFPALPIKELPIQRGDKFSTETILLRVARADANRSHALSLFLDICPRMPKHADVAQRQGMI